MYGWGCNQYNQLGFTGETKWQTPTKIPHLKQAECIRIITGSYQTFAMSYNCPPLDSVSSNALKGENANKKNINEKDFQKLLTDYDKMKREKELSEQKLKLQQSEIDQLKLELRRKKSLIFFSHFIKETILGENDIKPTKSPAFDPEKPLPIPRDFTPNYEIEYNDLTFGDQISEGGYGKIYKGRWRETLVAIKMLKMEGASETHVRDFLCKFKKKLFKKCIFF